jgi:predicted nucleic acid-binding protein
VILNVRKKYSTTSYIANIPLLSILLFKHEVNMQKVYIETSVVSYFTGETNRNIIIAGHQASTKDFWAKLNIEIEPVISALVIKEASQGAEEKAKARANALQGFIVIDISSEAEHLADLLVINNGIPKEFPEDALHIAIAAVANIDFIATWNFKHINNPFTKNKIKKIIEDTGYVCPVLASPEELLGEES